LRELRKDFLLEREAIREIVRSAEDSVASSRGRKVVEEKRKGSKDDEVSVERFEESRKEVSMRYRHEEGKEKEVKAMRRRGFGSNCLRSSLPVSRGNLEMVCERSHSLVSGDWPVLHVRTSELEVESGKEEKRELTICESIDLDRSFLDDNIIFA